MKTETSNTTEIGNNANLLLCPVIIKDDEIEDDYEDTEPDYYTCMCCGNVQQSSIDCNRCCGPVVGEFL
jgi:hypothetical protein